MSLKLFGPSNIIFIIIFNYNYIFYNYAMQMGDTRHFRGITHKGTAHKGATLKASTQKTAIKTIIYHKRLS